MQVCLAIGVCQRVAAAVIGCYALAAAVSAWLSLVLPIARADAVLSGLLVSFPLYAAAILWVFAVRSLRRMWWGIAGGTAVPLAVLTALSPALPL